MIDIGLNKAAVSEYFSSFQENNALYDGGITAPLAFGPGCNDWVTWRDFWTPATTNTKFRVASACSTCKTSSLSGYDENVAYHMTNYYFTIGKGLDNSCARDETTGEPIDYTYRTNVRSTAMCNVCDYDSNGKRANKLWSECPALQLSADTMAKHANHEYSLLSKYMLVQPSVAGDRSYCTCYQPMIKEITDYTVSKSELPMVAIAYKYSSAYTVDENIIWDTEQETVNNDCTAKYYLSSTDFMDGTLKIKVCGEYILSEDISVNFNAPSAEVQASDDFSPNSIDVEDLYWYPTTAQQDSGEYPGLDVFHDVYQLGFFTAISIQANDVIINLNGFTIEMEMKFYLQQRVFSIIELGNRNFIKDQGQTLNLGKEFIPVSNIVIKGGTIGRSSHHGIHGNEATEVHIINVKISDFDIAGIHLNGCSNVRITNVVVGPQANDIPVLGRYVHGRSVLPRVRYFADLHGDTVIHFGKNNPHKDSKTVRELADALVTQMDLMYFHIIDGVKHDDSNEDWIAAKSIFHNEGGWLDGGSSYGILINGHGSAVTCLGRRDEAVSAVTLTNVEIFGIEIAPIERVLGSVATFHHKMHGFFFDALDWDKITHEDGRYVGDVYTDIVIAANELMQEELCFLNTLYANPLHDWVFNDDQTIKVDMHGGSDIQTHDAKGAMGLRVDQTHGFTATNLYVHDITNYGGLGSTECCGDWEVIGFITRTYVDIEPGYTGTRAHGIVLDFMDGSLTDVVVENIESHFGSAIGMSIYKGTKIGKLANVEVSNVNAGSKLGKEKGLALGLPNMVPFACSVEFGLNTDVPADQNPISIKHMDEDTIVGRNIFGHDVCEGERVVGSISNDEEVDGMNSFVHYFVSLPISGYYGLGFMLFVFLSVFVSIYYYYRCRKSKKVDKFERNYGAVDFHDEM